MSSPTSGGLPKLNVADFASGQDHVAISYQNGRIFAILHKNDPAHRFFPHVDFDPNDLHDYVFVHGSQEVSRFENLRFGTREIPVPVVAQLLMREYGNSLQGRELRMCSCYGNMLRPGDRQTVVGELAGRLPMTSFEAYHGLVHLDLTHSPPRIVLGDQLAWDPITGPFQVGPPGPWEPVHP